MLKWIEVYKPSLVPEAYLVRDWLEDHGVRTQLRGEALTGLGGAIPVQEAVPSVWVPAWQGDRAREALLTFAGPSHPVPAWTCACGIENDGHFASCWSCGADQPGIPPHTT